eukprot:321130-Rhodomonas_salina.1
MGQRARGCGEQCSPDQVIAAMQVHDAAAPSLGTQTTLGVSNTGAQLPVSRARSAALVAVRVTSCSDEGSAAMERTWQRKVMQGVEEEEASRL